MGMRVEGILWLNRGYGDMVLVCGEGDAAGTNLVYQSIGGYCVAANEDDISLWDKVKDCGINDEFYRYVFSCEFFCKEDAFVFGSGFCTDNREVFS